MYTIQRETKSVYKHLTETPDGTTGKALVRNVKVTVSNNEESHSIIIIIFIISDLRNARGGVLYFVRAYFMLVNTLQSQISAPPIRWVVL